MFYRTIKKKILGLFILLPVSLISYSQNAYLNITSPSSKRIEVAKISNSSHQITLSTNQSWRTRVTNRNFDIDAEGSGNKTLTLTIRVPNFSSYELIDTIFIYAENAFLEDYLIVAQSPLGRINGVSYTNIINDMSYDGIEEWKHLYGGAAIDDYYNIFPINGGGWIGTGWSKSDGFSYNYPSSSDWVFNKINANYEIEWTKIYGGTNYDVNFFSTLTSDGGIVACGFASPSFSETFNTSNGKEDIWVIKLNSDGDLVWKKNIGSSGFDNVEKIIETSEGNFIISGSSGQKDNDFSSINSNYGASIFAMQLSSQGNILWSFGLNGKGKYFGKIVTPLRNGSYLLGGDIEITAPNSLTLKGDKDIWVGNISKTGTLLNELNLGGSLNDSLSDIASNYNGDWIVASESNSQNGNVMPSSSQSSYNIYLQQLDSNQSLINSKIIGGNFEEKSSKVTYTHDGNILVIYNSNSNNGKYAGTNYNFLDNDMWVEKYDKNFNLIWDYHFGGSGFDFAHNLYLNHNGGALIAGHVNSIEYPANNASIGSRDGIILNVNEAYLSTLPKQVSISKQSKDSAIIIIVSRNSKFAIDVNGNNDEINITRNQLANQNITKVVIKRSIENQSIENYELYVSIPNTDLVDTVSLEIMPISFIKLTPDTLFIQDEVNSQGIINLTSNTTWKSSLSRTNNFFSLSKNAGNSNSTLIITANTANTTRNYFIDSIVAYTDDNLGSDKSYIYQVPEDFFIFSPEKLEFDPYKNLNKTITVETNLKWNYALNSSFFAVKKTQLSNFIYDLNVSTLKDNWGKKEIQALTFNCLICNDTNAQLIQNNLEIQNNTLLENNIRIFSNYALPVGYYAHLYDLTGEPLYRIDLSNQNDTRQNISSLPSGYYYFGIFSNSNERIKVGKVLKK